MAAPVVQPTLTPAQAAQSVQPMPVRIVGQAEAAQPLTPASQGLQFPHI